MILTILLTILKIIGIILLSILGLILFILLIVLFVPIRYRAKFKRTGIDGDPPVEAGAVVSWILHIIHIRIDYVSGVVVCARVFGIPVYRIPNNKKKKKDIKGKKKDNQKVLKTGVEENVESDAKINTEAPEANNVANAEATIEAETEANAEATIEAETEANAEATIEAETEANAETNAEAETEANTEDIIEDEIKEDEEDDFSEEHKSIFEKLSDLFEKLKCTITNAYDIVKGIIGGSKEKISKAKKNIEYYHTILTSDLFDRTFAKTKTKIFKLLKSIFPQYLDVNMEVGFDNPATTGQVLAIYSSLYAFLWKHIHVKGNFEENVIRGNGKLRGRIFIFSFVKILVYYFTNKNLKKLLRLLKKEGKQNGRK